MKEKNTLVAQICVLSDTICVRNYLFHKNYITSKGAVSHYELLSIAHYQVSFHVLCLKINYLGLLPIVSCACNVNLREDFTSSPVPTCILATSYFKSQVINHKGNRLYWQCPCLIMVMFLLQQTV